MSELGAAQIQDRNRSFSKRFMPTLRLRRQEEFSQLVAAGLPAKQAYVQAYACKTEGTARTNSSRLLTVTEVRERINELQAQKQEKLLAETRAIAAREKLSREYVISSLRRVADDSMSLIPILDRKGALIGKSMADPQAANRALELLGKELGMFVDRSEFGRPGEFERLSRMTEAELDAEEARIVAEINIEHERKKGAVLSIVPRLDPNLGAAKMLGERAECSTAPAIGHEPDGS